MDFTHQSRPLDLFGPGALQLRAFFPLSPDKLLLQKKDLKVFIHLHPLTLLPLQVIKLYVYLRRERKNITLLTPFPLKHNCGSQKCTLFLHQVYLVAEQRIFVFVSLAHTLQQSWNTKLLFFWVFQSYNPLGRFPQRGVTCINDYYNSERCGLRTIFTLWEADTTPKLARESQKQIFH